MRGNMYWYVFLALIGLSVLGYTGFTVIKIYDYSRMSQKADPLAIKWSILKFANDHYDLESEYEFSWDGRTYSGNMTASDHHLNFLSAKDALKRASQRHFDIWFDPEVPQHSTIFRHFPLKYSVYSGILWLLLFYFIWLGYSTTRYKK